MHRLTDWSQKDNITGTLVLACCCLFKSFHSYYVVQDDDDHKRELELEVGQRKKYHGFFFRLHALEFFGVPPTKRLPVYAPVVVIYNEIETSLFLHVLSSLCLANYSDVQFCDDDRKTQQ